MGVDGNEEALRKIGHIEHAGRLANEETREDADGSDGAGSAQSYVCECGDATCQEPLRMSLAEYEQVRSHAAHFAVLPDHVIEGAEVVVDRRDGYWVIEKTGVGGEVARETDPRHHLKTLRVVVIDDVVEVRILLKMLLQLEPTCTVVGEGGTGLDAVELARQCAPDVMILDLQMPVMGGEEALPEVLSASPDTKVIIFSGSPVRGPGMDKRLLNSGAYRIVPKGGDPAALVEVVKNAASDDAS